jgi:hypothetical protein
MNIEHAAATTLTDATAPQDGCLADTGQSLGRPACADHADHAEATITLTLTQVDDLVDLLDEIDEFLRTGRGNIDALTDFYRTRHDDDHPRFVALCLVDSISFTALCLRGQAKAAGAPGADR